MNPKHLLLPCMLFCMAVPSQAQLLKKIKDKVNKTIGNDSSSEKTEQTSSASNNIEKEKEKGPKWCDTITVEGEGAGKDGIAYTLAYTSAGSVDILYDESALGLVNDSKGYRMILSERVNNKQQYLVVENGKVINTDNKINTKYIIKGASQSDPKTAGSQNDAAMQKYIVGDTLKQNIPKTDAKSVTVQKIDDDQFQMALDMARQTDDYKSMSDAEKKEFEETMREGIAKNNSMAGTTIPIPAQQGGDVAIVNGYFLIVKGKNYGKFQTPPIIDVSRDETKIFAVGTDDKGNPVMIANGKKTNLDKNKYSAMTGQIIRSPDQKRFVYIEQKKMSDAEIDEMMKAASANKPTKMTYNVIKSDGSSLAVTDHNYSGKFRLTNSGQVICINESTGEVYADNKPAGKFALGSGDRIETDAVMIGNDMSQVAYYNGNEGSLTYLDGKVKKMNIIFPQVISDNGKSYLSWFRKCGNKIYIARFAY